MKKKIVLFLIFFDILLLFSILLRHYILNELWIFGDIFLAILLLINIIITIYLVIKYRNILLLSNIFVSILSIIIFVNSIDDKIALNIELYKAKTNLEKMKENNDIVFKNVSTDSGLYAFTYVTGVTDNWAAIVYDDTGFLDKGIIIINNNKSYYYSDEYDKIKKLFGGDIINIVKIEKNWYLCCFT
jgi:hypothetical protein